MTWTTAIADGSCNFGLWLEIAGFGVFGSVNYTPSDTWCNDYSTEGRVYPWLDFESIDGWREEVDFLEASLKVSGITPRIIDVGGGMTALFKNYRGGAYTRISAQLASTATTASVDDAAEFNSSGLLWIGQECCKYTGKTASSFTGLTRGYLGTQSTTHEYNVDVLPPRRSVVGDNPATLVGRRAYLHFASYSHGTNAYSATEIIYRGRVRKGIGVRGGAYTVPVEHISEALKQKIGRGMGEARLKSNRYRFGDAGNMKKMTARVVKSGSTKAFNMEIDAGNYSDGSLLAEVRAAWQSAFSSYTASGWYPWIVRRGDKIEIESGTAAGVSFYFDVKKYDPLWCLGFEVATYGKNLDSDGLDFEAQDEPRPLVVDGSGSFTIEVDHYGQIANLSSVSAYIPGSDHPLLRVYSTGTTSVKARAYTSDPSNLQRTNTVMYVSDSKDLVLRDCVRLAGQVDDIIKQCYSLQDPATTTAARYMASGVLSSDFDFDELEDSYIGQDWPIYTNFHLVTKEVEVQSLIAPTLAIMGICPRITDAAKIGWVNYVAPTELEANPVEVDGDVWANIEAAKIESKINATPLVNVISVKVNKDFQEKNEAKDEVNCFHLDGLNELGETKRLEYDSMVKEHWLHDLASISDRLNETFTSFHFPIFGRESAVVEIPCNWRAKQIKCGDLVKITHELIYDTVRGTIGVTDALGLVVGRKLAIASGNDILRVRIFSGDPWKAVAPTALATAYYSTSAYMSCADTSLYCKPGDTDLTYFNSTSNVNVRLYPYDVSGSTSYLATVTSVNEATRRIYFSSTPLTTTEWTTSGFWIVLADWDNRTSSAASGFAYTCDTGSPPSLGTTADNPHRWGP